MSQMLSHVLGRHLRPSLSVIPSLLPLCLRLSVRSPAGPTPSSVRPQRPPSTPRTHEGELAGTRRGRGGKNYLNTAGRKAADIALQHLTHSPPSVAPLSFPFFAHCSQWKHVKISKLRPSEHNQWAGHTQRDR